MKHIIWKVELVCAAILVICAAVWGFRPGVWSGSTFYRMESQEQGRSYTHSDKPTVEVINGAEDGCLRILSPEGQTAEFTLSLTENGSYRAVRMASDGRIWNATYNASAGTFMDGGENTHSISALVYERAHFSPGMTDATLYSMALGNDSSRICGRMGEFLLGALFLALGLSFRFLLEPLLKLDAFLTGFFYENKDGEPLQATQLSRTILSLFGIAFFVLGAIWWCDILFA